MLPMKYVKGEAEEISQCTLPQEKQKASQRKFSLASGTV